MIKFTDGKGIYTLTDNRELIGLDESTAKDVKLALDVESYQWSAFGIGKETVDILKEDFDFKILEDTSEPYPEFAKY